MSEKVDPVVSLLERYARLTEAFVDTLFPFNDEATSRCCDFCSVHDGEDHRPDCLVGQALEVLLLHHDLATPSDAALAKNSGFTEDYVDWATWKQLMTPGETA